MQYLFSLEFIFLSQLFIEFRNNEEGKREREREELCITVISIKTHHIINIFHFLLT